MKKTNFNLVLLAMFLLFSCEGEFNEADLAIYLNFPVNNAPCFEGTKVNDKVTIPFEWEIDGNLNGLQIEIEELDSNKTPVEGTNKIIESFEATETEMGIALDYGKWYQWKISSSSSGIQSETFTFFSEGEPSENKVPFPSIITIIQNFNGNVRFTWSVPADDQDGIPETYEYDAFFGETKEAETEIKPGMITPEVLSLEPVESGKEYYIKLIAKEKNVTNFTGNASIAFYKIKVN